MDGKTPQNSEILMSYANASGRENVLADIQLMIEEKYATI